MLEAVVVQQDVTLPAAVRSAAKKVLVVKAPDVAKALDKHLASSLLLDSMGETKRTERLKAFSRAAKIDAEQLALLLLERRGVCTDFLFFHCGAETAGRALTRLLNGGTTLTLEAKELADLPKGVAKLPIERAALSNNHFTAIPPSLLKVESLRELDFGRTNITKLQLPPGVWPRLEALDLSYSRLKAFPPGVLELTGLKKLMLSGMKFRVPEGIGALRNLELLELGVAETDEWPDDFAQLQKLKTLRLFSSQLGDVPRVLGDLSSLEQIQVESTSWATGAKLATLKRLVPKAKIVTTY